MWSYGTLFVRHRTEIAVCLRMKSFRAEKILMFASRVSLWRARGFHVARVLYLSANARCVSVLGAAKPSCTARFSLSARDY